MRLTLSICLSLLAVAAAPNAARCDDGGISYGGNPHLLSGHPSISMQSEVVRMDIRKDIISVDCQFVFHNNGAACSVRMGFPDQGEGSEEPYMGDPIPKGPGLKATFLTYESLVDGKKVPTTVVSTNDRTLYWHAKSVQFPANSTRIIRDLYTLKPGGQVTIENGFYHQTYYVLHTGASWHGPIGKADIEVRFSPDVQSVPIKLRPRGSFSGPLAEVKWSKLPAGTVIYEGPCRPNVEGNTLTFHCANIRPTNQDDIHLYYAYEQPQPLNKTAMLSMLLSPHTRLALRAHCISHSNVCGTFKQMNKNAAPIAKRCNLQAAFLTINTGRTISMAMANHAHCRSSAISWRSTVIGGSQGRQSRKQ